jgi:hypothetical protein
MRLVPRRARAYHWRAPHRGAKGIAVPWYVDTFLVVLVLGGFWAALSG